MGLKYGIGRNFMIYKTLLKSKYFNILIDHKKSNQLGHFSPFSTYLRSIFKMPYVGTEKLLRGVWKSRWPDSNTLLKLSKKLFFLETKKFMVETKTMKQKV